MIKPGIRLTLVNLGMLRAVACPKLDQPAEWSSQGRIAGYQVVVTKPVTKEERCFGTQRIGAQTRSTQRNRCFVRALVLLGTTESRSQLEKCGCAVKHRTCYPCRAVVRKKSESSVMDRCVTYRQRFMQRLNRWLASKRLATRLAKKTLFPSARLTTAKATHSPRFLQVGLSTNTSPNFSA